MTPICEDDDWRLDGDKITDKLEALRKVLEDDGPIIVEHRHYRGARSPDRAVFEDIEDFQAYLKNKTIPGDAISVWNFVRVCNDQNALAHGKCPDGLGRVPRRGAY